MVLDLVCLVNEIRLIYETLKKGPVGASSLISLKRWIPTGIRCLKYIKIANDGNCIKTLQGVVSQSTTRKLIQNIYVLTNIDRNTAYGVLGI